MFFWNSLASSMIQWMLAIWSLVPLPFINPACTSGVSQFMQCWSLAWRFWDHSLVVEKGLAKLKEAMSHAVQGHLRWTGHSGEFWQSVVHWRREWQTTPVFLLQQPQEQFEKEKVWGRGWICFILFFMQIAICFSSFCWKDNNFPLNCLGTFAKN